MYYHNDRKLAFINDLSTNIASSKAVKSLFSDTYPLEQELNKDISEFKLDEYNKFLKDGKTHFTNPEKLTLVILKEYVKWCSKHDYRTTNDLFNITLSDSEQIKTFMVGSPEDLQNKIDRLFEKEEEETIDNVYRAYIWMIYMGLDKEEAAQITNNNIEEDEDGSRYIFKDNTYYKMYELSFPAFKNCETLKQFRVYHRNPDYEVFKNRAQGDLILRGIRTPNVGVDTIQKVVRRRAKEERAKDYHYKFAYTDSDICLSGMFYRIYLREQRGFEADFTAIAKKRFKNEFTENQSLRLKNLKRKYRVKYEKWKLTFYREHVN